MSKREIKTYQFGFGQLSTDLDFPELTVSQTNFGTKFSFSLFKSDKEIDLATLEPFHSWISEGEKQSNLWLNFYTDEKNFFVEYPNFCIFCLNISKAEINYFSLKPGFLSTPDFRHFFLDQVLPLYLSKFYSVVFHAAALADIKSLKAFAVLGKSGSGKSTIASELLSEYQFISDDFLPVKLLDNHWQVFASYPIVRLWSEVKSNFLIKSELVKFEYSQKQRYFVSKSVLNQKFNLSFLLFLKRNLNLKAGEFKLNQISADQKFSELLKNIFILDFSKAAQQNSLEVLAQISKDLPCYELEFSDLINNSEQIKNRIKELL